MVKAGAWVLAVAFGIAASQVQAFRAINSHEVFAVDEDSFEVIRSTHSGPAPVWCAAGDYAQSVLRMRSNARIFIERGPGPSVTRPGRISFVFTSAVPTGFDPAEPRPLSLDLGRIGDSLSVVSAYMYCIDDWVRDP